MPNPFEEVKIVEGAVDTAEAFAKGGDASHALLEGAMGGAGKAAGDPSVLGALREQEFALDQKILHVVAPGSSISIAEAPGEDIAPLARSLDADGRPLNPIDPAYPNRTSWSWGGSETAPLARSLGADGAPLKPIDPAYPYRTSWSWGGPETPQTWTENLAKRWKS